MKKRTKILALVLALGMTLTGCGGAGGSKGGSSTEGIKDLVTWETSNREMENVVIWNTEMASDLNVLGNCYEGLLETDAEGKLLPGLANKMGWKKIKSSFAKKESWVDQFAGKWKDSRSTDEIIADIHNARTSNDEVSL